MNSNKEVLKAPDLSKRPFHLRVERLMTLKPETLFLAWTTGWEKWFAAPGSLLAEGKENTPFFFQTEFRGDPNAPLERHPHYGRFLKLIPHQLIKLTWVTGEGGTLGAETVLTVEFIPKEEQTFVKLSHSGFADETSKNKYLDAWPMVLEHL